MQFFLILSFSSCGVLIPLQIMTNTSDDQNAKITLIEKWSLIPNFEDETIAVAALILTAVYTILAYYFLIKFATEMSQTEFQSTDTFLDNFVARHALIIRGVYKNLGTEQIAKTMRRVFEHRFGKDKIISCNTFRPIQYAQKLFGKVKFYKRKMDEMEEVQLGVNSNKSISFGRPEPVKIWVG